MVHFVFPAKDDFEQKMGVEGGKRLLWQHDTALEEQNGPGFSFRPSAIATPLHHPSIEQVMPPCELRASTWGKTRDRLH